MALSMRASRAATVARTNSVAGRTAVRPVLVVRATEGGETPASAPTPAPGGSTVFYGGKEYTEAEWAAAVASGSVVTAPAPKGGVGATAGSGTGAAAISLQNAMAFGGPAPELINGRLAMLGFVTAVAAELSSGVGVWQQWACEPAGIAAVFALFSAASLIPLVAGRKESLGPFTPEAEKLNGRAAMIGFAALLAIEAVQKAPLF